MRRFRIGMSIVLIALLTGCGSSNSGNTSEDAMPTQTEIHIPDAGSENSADESDEDDIAEGKGETTEQEVETTQTDDGVEDIDGTDGSDDGGTLQLKPCSTYQDILDNAYEVIIADNMTEIVPGDDIFSDIGIWEATLGRTASEALAAIGYTFYDVDGNGIEELIIMDTGEGVWNNRILLMYTLHDNKPVRLLDGWARNRYHLLNDATIYYEGSGGAAYTSVGIYRIAEDGISMEVIDYYYTGQIGDSEYGWFYNTTGEQTEDESEITENDEMPVAMMRNYIDQVKELELTFFSEFN